MKKSAFALFAVALLTSGTAARAVICTIDQVPAATLLLPHFEVDLDDLWGVNTLFSINNASASAVLAHVVLWSDLSVPTFDFNIYLTGYDIQTVSVRDIFAGTVPRTASAGQDPGDTISPKGLFSQDINFASCSGQLPPPPVPPAFVTHLRAAHTGQFSSILGGCAGRDLGDHIARGYITIDTVNNCTLRFPGDAGYFASGGNGDATNQNVLWGDYFFVRDRENAAEGDTLVHVEASATNPETSTPGQYTFYGRYVSWSAADNREPLATTFAARFVNGGTFDGGTDYTVWRDSKVDQTAFKCGTLPSWYPLGTEAIVIFDEQEHPEVQEVPPFSPPPPGDFLIPFPAEAQRVAVDSDALPTSFDFGWMDLNLNTGVVPAGPNPPEDQFAAQAWVSVLMEASGRFGVGFDAVQLDSACTTLHDAPSAP
ncbi:MAG TPA: hypothetical protein VN783_07295 [Thermoanaerobaculia bacterium]|nr:hypothetical protein [Thermoanaerobaculia bacterium]